MKIIFLDIDGVLNNTRTKETVDDFIFVEDNKILLLKEIINKTGAKIVLSSSWRKGWRFKEENPKCASVEVRLFKALELKLKSHGIELMSYTPHLWQRGEEIEIWLDEWRGEEIESFVILDDMEEGEFTPNSDRLIRTDICIGLTKRHVDLAIKLLNEKE